MDLLLKTFLGDDTELLQDAEHQCADPVGDFVRSVQLQKYVPGVADESWASPMGDPADECFEKAFLSATAAMETFLEKHAHCSGPLPWEELRKSFREERKCRLQ
jgi:hypothetical protein